MKWPTPYFTRAEFACKCGCGLDTIDYETVMGCHAIREHFGRPTRINSGCRCESYNAAIGGSPGSYHVKCRAADVEVEDVPASIVQEFVEQELDMGGVGCYESFTHIDSRHGKSRWSG